MSATTQQLFFMTTVSVIDLSLQQALAADKLLAAVPAEKGKN